VQIKLKCEASKSTAYIVIVYFFLTGTVLFSSKSGSGGGAIELIAENGILTVGKRLRILRI